MIENLALFSLFNFFLISGLFFSAVFYSGQYCNNLDTVLLLS